MEMVVFISNKRSQGHIEFIISFLLFLSAIIFLLLITNSIRSPETKIKIQENAKNLIIDNISAIVGKLDIVAESPYCYSFNPSTYGDIFFETYETLDSNKRIYEIYFSESFPSNEHPNYKESSESSECKYVIGSYIDEKIIIRSKIIDLKRIYEQNYKELKKQLGISNDFTFTFKDKDNKIIDELSVQIRTSKNVNKYSSEFLTRLIDEVANINETIININLW
jgi:hypothetical protein